MPAKGKKSLPIDQDVHRLIKLEATARGTQISKLIRQMWEEFKERHGSLAESLLEQLDQADQVRAHKGGKKR